MIHIILNKNQLDLFCKVLHYFQSPPTPLLVYLAKLLSSGPSDNQFMQSGEVETYWNNQQVETYMLIYNEDLRGNLKKLRVW